MGRHTPVTSHVEETLLHVEDDKDLSWSVRFDRDIKTSSRRGQLTALFLSSLSYSYLSAKAKPTSDAAETRPVATALNFILQRWRGTEREMLYEADEVEVEAEADDGGGEEEKRHISTGHRHRFIPILLPRHRASPSPPPRHQNHAIMPVPSSTPHTTRLPIHCPPPSPNPPSRPAGPHRAHPRGPPPLFVHQTAAQCKPRPSSY